MNPNSLGTADPQNPTQFLARVSSAKGGRDSVLWIGRGDTPIEEDSPLIGFRVKVEARSNLTVPVLPQGEPQSSCFSSFWPRGGSLLPGASRGNGHFRHPGQRCQGASVKPVFIITYCKTLHSLRRNTRVNICCLSRQAWLLVMSS